jgi:hypothetical protein
MTATLHLYSGETLMLWNWFKKKPQRAYQRPQVEMPSQARAMTIKMDSKTVTDDIVKDIRRQVSELSEVPAAERKFVADQAIESVREGGYGICGSG